MRRRSIRPPSGPFVLNRSSAQANGLRAWWPLDALRGRTTLPGFAHAEPAMTILGAGVQASADSEIGGMYFTGGAETTIRAAVPVLVSIPFSITALVKPAFVNGSGTTVYAKVVSGYVGNSSPYTAYHIGVNNSSPAKWECQISNAAGTIASAQSTSTLSLNTVYAVALTYDGAALRFYINGVQDGGVATDIIPQAPSQTDIGNFGRQVTTNLWKGWIADVRFYNRVLNANDAWQLYDPTTRWELYDTVRRLFSGYDFTDNLTSVGLATGAPTIGAGTLAQVHVVGGVGLVTGAPTLAAATLAQVHALGGVGLVTGAATIGAGTLSGFGGVTPAYRTYTVAAESRVYRVTGG